MAERRPPRAAARQSSRRYFTRSSRDPSSPRNSLHADKHDPGLDNNNVDSSEDMNSSTDNILANLRRDTGFYSDRERNSSLTSASSMFTGPQNVTTSSSLAGIFAAVGDKDILDTDSPWDTGPDRPIRREPGMDESLYNLLRDRCYPPSRRRVYSMSHQAGPPKPPLTVALARFLSRSGALLFVLGTAFAVLITYFHREQRHWILTLGYLAFWGTVGVAIGGLQPLFDKLWEATFPDELERRDDESKRVEEPRPMRDLRPVTTHWILAMRAVGTVMGIVYAFRNLIWTSTIQFSVGLAVINPIFWWAVDRSKTGFIFSAGAAIIGSILLLGSDAKLVPSPPTISTILQNTTTNNTNRADFYLTLGGRTSMESAEEAIWILSVLFCSAVCFGNVGRVLAADHSVKVVPWDPTVKMQDH